jgi:hypothetical protein
MSKISILNFREYKKNTLLGFFDVRINQTTMIISGCSLHTKNGKYWVGYPAKPYEVDGVTKWQNIVSLDDKDMNQRFQDSVLGALRDEAII